MFTLLDYEKEIKDYMRKTNTTAEEATSQFIYNLAVLRPHFDKFNSQVDFRLLGQRWNNLMSDVRNQQRAAVIKNLTRNRE